MGSGQRVRRAIPSDIPCLIDMIESLTLCVSGPQRVDRVKTGETLSGLIQSPDGIVFISPGGFIAGQIGETSISREPVAFEMGWYASDRSGLRLLQAFEEWAEGKGASLIKMSCDGGPVAGLLERMGYKRAETAMVK